MKFLHSELTRYGASTTWRPVGSSEWSEWHQPNALIIDMLIGRWMTGLKESLGLKGLTDELLHVAAHQEDGGQQAHQNPREDEAEAHATGNEETHHKQKKKRMISHYISVTHFCLSGILKGNEQFYFTVVLFPNGYLVFCLSLIF